VTVSLIWAQCDGGVIGNAGGLPWHLPEDLARFKSLTAGATVVMGRATWDSLPERFRPLPGRRNLVLTGQPDWREPGATRISSLDEGLAITDGDVWVIGGGSVYRAALPLAERMVVTEVDGRYDGDTFAPPVDQSWQVVERDPADGWHTSAGGIRFRVTTYQRAS
jgi:dihydrofolate reductase